MKKRRPLVSGPPLFGMTASDYFVGASGKGAGAE
jgi:hypothetical protein